MITINKAILHILDAHSKITVFSEEELDFRSEQVFLFLTKHIEKIFSDSNAKEGAFLPTSAFKSELFQEKGIPLRTRIQDFENSKIGDEIHEYFISDFLFMGQPLFILGSRWFGN